MFVAAARTWHLVGPQRRRRFLAVSALSAIVSALEAISAVMVAVLMGFVLDAGQIPDFPVIGDPRQLFPDQTYESFVTWSCAVFAVFFVARGIIFLGQQYALARVAQNTGLALSDRLVAGYLSMPYEFHLSRNSAELVRNSFDNVQQVVNGVFSPMAHLVAESLIVVSLLAVLLASSVTITVSAGIAMGVALLTTMTLVQPRIQRLGTARNKAVKDTMQGLQQGFSGVRDVKILAREDAFSDSFRSSRASLARAQYLKAALALTPRVTVEVTFLLLVAGALAVAVRSGSVAELLPTLGLFAYAGLRLQPSIQKIANSLNSLRFAEAAVSDLASDMEDIEHALSSRRTEDKDKVPLALTTELRIDGLSYTYPGSNTPALRDVAFSVPAGSSLGIAGSTGGGKSTLLDLLCGLLPATSGRIMVDGRDIADRTRAWQKGLGVVHQSPFLTDDTIRRNIALGVNDAQIDDEHLRRCIEIAQLAEVVDGLTDGVNTLTGERGVRLSGGQRQRIALARALYRKPSVLIIDEGTASLDNETERRVMSEIRDLGDITVIMVAHRLTTIADCDLLLVIDEGAIVARGTYDELITTSEDFRTLTSAESR